MTKSAARRAEAAAEMRIAQEAAAVHLLGERRLVLTDAELHVAALEREYLARCQTPEFRARQREFAQPAGRNPWLISELEKKNKDAPQPQVRIDMHLCYTWVAQRAHRDRWSVISILAHVEQVFILRDLDDHHCPPPAAVGTRRASSAAAPSTPPVRGAWWKDTSWIKVRKRKEHKHGIAQT